MNINNILLNFIKDYKYYAIFYVLFMMVHPIISIVLPKYYGGIIDELKNNKEPRFKITVILLVLTCIMYFILDKIDVYFIPKFQSYIRVNIVKAVIENYKDNFKEQELGFLISKIIKLPITLKELFFQFRHFIVPIILLFIFAVIQFGLINKNLGLMCLTGVISEILILYPMLKNCLNVSSDSDFYTDTEHESIVEIFDNLLDVYSMDTCEEEIKNLEKYQEQVNERYANTLDCVKNFRVYVVIINFIVFISLIYVSYKLYMNKQIGLPSMINVSLSSMIIITKIDNFSSQMQNLVFSMGTYIRISNFLKDFEVSPNINENFKINNGKVSYNNVSIKYGDKKILDNFNLEINPHESITIVGKIGTGKSSLVKALLRLLPYEGNIYVDDKNIKELNTNTIRKQILYVRQNPLPFNRTLYENISYGNKNISREKVNEIFKKYNLDNFFNNYNLDEKVGKKGDNLSGGQCQMIFLIRVLLSDKPIVILDEPTSSLDSESSKYIWKILEEITNKSTVIIITHDPSLSKLTKRKIEL